MWFLYHAGIYLFVFAIRISSIWDPKSGSWLQGRKGWKDRIKTYSSKSNPRIWFHVSSLGEFEQAKPVIEKIKKDDPDIDIILSFFSPSGFDVKRNYSLATVVYLPPDLPGHAKYFIDTIKPDAAVFTKYDLWPGYLKYLTDKNIPTFLISAYWKPGRMSSWSLPLNKSLLKKFKKIFFQRNDHLDYFKKEGFDNIIVAGDTRIDRSLLLPHEVHDRLPDNISDLTPFELVAGSTWHEDERILIPAIRELNIKAIIAPHDVSKEHIRQLIADLPFTYQLLSELKQNQFHSQVLIIDSVGLLSVLYALGNIAYVGGGFGKGIHNILEPVAHTRPVVFGPRYETFPEAVDLIKMNAAWSIHDDQELKRVFRHLLDPDNSKHAGEEAFGYLRDRAGATPIVTKYIMESIPYSLKA